MSVNCRMFLTILLKLATEFQNRGFDAMVSHNTIIFTRLTAAFHSHGSVYETST